MGQMLVSVRISHLLTFSNTPQSLSPRETPSIGPPGKNPADVDTFITDKNAPPEALKRFAKLGANVVVVSP